jgi:hypothetical protein
MAALIARASRLGTPRREGAIPVAGSQVAGQYFGTDLVNNTTDLFD